MFWQPAQTHCLKYGEFIPFFPLKIWQHSHLLDSFFLLPPWENSQKKNAGPLFFLLSFFNFFKKLKKLYIYVCSWNCNHPKGNNQDMKVKMFEHPWHFWLHARNLIVFFFWVGGGRGPIFGHLVKKEIQADSYNGEKTVPNLPSLEEIICWNCHILDNRFQHVAKI
jgi:hypothetical protein